MNKPDIIHFFEANTRTIIKKHIEHINYALNTYDVVIFMARKSVCLLRAFVINGETNIPNKVMLLSSRALTYEISDVLKDKRVAVVDDVVVYGKSVSGVVDKLKQIGVTPDIYVIACEKDATDTISFRDHIAEGWQELKREDIHQISEKITEYIYASGISYNIDQPIYSGKLDSEEIDRIKKYNNTFEVSDGLQQTYGIRNFTIHYKSDIANACVNIPCQGDYSILKIRFLYDEKSSFFTALPFVLFGEMSVEQIEKLYDEVVGNYYDKFIGDGECQYANKLKLLHYILSDTFLQHFLNANKMEGVKRETFNEKMLFSFFVSDNAFAGKKISGCDLSYYNEINRADDKHLFDEWMGEAYHILLDVEENNYRKYHEIGKIDDTDQTMITYEDLTEGLVKCFKNVDSYVTSAVADIFIDKGILIPIVIKNKSNGNIMRGFKLGEIFHLTKEALGLFHYMLYQYQTYQGGRYLDRTEYEKLCVLFMKRAGYEGSILSSVKSYGQDCYSICYTRFGPRVSSGDNPLMVNQNSTLAHRMTLGDMLISRQDGKYVVKRPVGGLREDWVATADNFAFSYATMRNLFETDMSLKSDYIRSFNEFITIDAIGPTKRDKLFSLAAELNLFCKIDLSQSINDILYQMFHTVKDPTGMTRPKVYGIMDGIQSGVWKYICFEERDLMKNMFKALTHADKSMRYLYESYLKETGDENDIYDDLIRKSGDTLLRIASCYYKVATMRDDRFRFRRYLLDSPQFQLTRNQLESVESVDELIKEFQNLHLMARTIIDKCNLIAETGSGAITNLSGSYQVISTKERVDNAEYTIGNGEDSWHLVKRSLDEGIKDTICDSNIRKPYLQINLDDNLLAISKNGSSIKCGNLTDVIKKGFEKLEEAESDAVVIGSDLTKDSSEEKTGIEAEKPNAVTVYLCMGDISMNTYNIGSMNTTGNAIIGENQVDLSELNISVTEDMSSLLVAIRDLNAEDFPEEIRKEIIEIKEESKISKSSEGMKGLLKRLGSAIGKIGFDTAKTVVPKLLLNALTSGGFLE